MTQREYDAFLRAFHRPAHGRRTASRAAGFFLPHLRAGMRVLDIGCGPASITAGLVEVTGSGVGVDLDVDAGAAPPLARADAFRLPFADATFDALFAHAVLQHVAEPSALVREARRAAAPGAVIGLADADWGATFFEPDDPVLDRSTAIREALRPGVDLRVGRRLGRLLHDAGFERVEVACRNVGPLDTDAARGMAASEAAFFEAEPVQAHVTALGLSDRDECVAIAGALRRWADQPGAMRLLLWFEAVGRAPA